MRARRLWFGLLGTLALAGLPVPAGAQAVGSEFQVNTYTTGVQETGNFPWRLDSSGRVIAAAANGDFVVVWTGRGLGDINGVFGQRYDSAGDSAGNEFRVNTTTAKSQKSPGVASDANGNFVVVWQSYKQDGSDDGVFGQRYDSAGGALGAEFQINSFTAQNQTRPSVAADASGDFVVVWQSHHAGNQGDIFARRYDSAGNALGPEFRVNSYTTNYQLTPAVASDPEGNFVVVWRTYPYPTGQAMVSGQRFDSGGNPLGGEFIVTGGGNPPSISSDASGNFVVVWYDLSPVDYDIWARRYDSGGMPLGPKFRVNTYTPSSQLDPKVASDEAGNFVVVWKSDGQDGAKDGVFGRLFDAAGVAQGQDFQINSYTTGEQWKASIAATGTNEFAVVWTSNDQDGNGKGVFGQRFNLAKPIAVEMPNTDVKWRIGSLHQIQWTHNLGVGQTFRIELDRNDDGTYEELIAAAAPADSALRGTFGWTVTGPPSATARVRLSWTDDLSVSDSSDVTFQIRPVSLDAERE